MTVALAERVQILAASLPEAAQAAEARGLGLTEWAYVHEGADLAGFGGWATLLVDASVTRITGDRYWGLIEAVRTLRRRGASLVLA